MYIKTEDFGIINLNLFQRVDILSEPEPYYYLTAFDKSDGTSDSDVVIATFEKKKEAENALDALFRTIKSDKQTWDAASFIANLGVPPVMIGAVVERNI